MTNEKGLLEGIVVLDLTRVLAGPYSGMMMADMGATVIKLENPNGGDDTRKMGPFVNDNSVYYANFNRSKLGCTLNLKAPEGKALFLELVKKADIVIENYRPGTMEKLGLGYDVLKEVNPAIIYGAVSGFGHTGPFSKRLARRPRHPHRHPPGRRTGRTEPHRGRSGGSGKPAENRPG